MTLIDKIREYMPQGKINVVQYVIGETNLEKVGYGLNPETFLKEIAASEEKLNFFIAIRRENIGKGKLKENTLRVLRSGDKTYLFQNLESIVDILEVYQCKE